MKTKSIFIALILLQAGAAFSQSKFYGYSEYCPGDTLHVLAQTGLLLRKLPNSNGEKIATLPFGAALTVLTDDLPKVSHQVEAFPNFELAGHWVKVRTAKGKEGYVFDGFLSRFAAPERLKVKAWLHREFRLQAQSLWEDQPTLPNTQVFKDGTICHYDYHSKDGGYFNFAIRFGPPMTLAEGWLLARALLFGKQETSIMLTENGMVIYPAGNATEDRIIEISFQHGKVEIRSSFYEPEGCGG